MGGGDSKGEHLRFHRGHKEASLHMRDNYWGKLILEAGESKKEGNGGMQPKKILHLKNSKKGKPSKERAYAETIL